jgi:hypothetical protein
MRHHIQENRAGSEVSRAQTQLSSAAHEQFRELGGLTAEYALQLLAAWPFPALKSSINCTHVLVMPRSIMMANDDDEKRDVWASFKEQHLYTRNIIRVNWCNFLN